MAVNKKRPVNMDLLTIRMPITAVVSILHRLSGLLTFLMIPVMLCYLDASLQGPEQFNAIAQGLRSPYCLGLIWIALLGLGYHLIAGIRHALADMNIGHTKQSAKLGAWLVLLVFLAYAAGITYRLWG